MRIFCLALFALLGGCVVEDHTDTSGAQGSSGNSPARDLNVQLRVVDETGAAVELNHFAAKTDVYLTVNISNPAKPVVAEDFVFAVIDATGRVLSTDAESCRQFHVDETGEIDSVGICDHALVNNLIGVAPFADASKYSLQITADDGERISVPFTSD